MKSFTFSQRVATALVLALGLAFFFATYNAINNIVAEQSRVQQEAISPVYDLVRDELLRPLYIAETFASSVDFTTGLDSSAVDEAALLRRLAKMEADLGLVFFVASERARKQYMSNGRVIDLIEGDVAWYFEAKALDKDFMADLGQVGDVHLFFDVKIYSAEREFLGYVGVGKRVQRFLDTFDEYKARYGYDFLFVNDQNEIILTSLPELVVTGAYIPTLESLEWFDHGDEPADSHDSEIIQIEDSDLLITELRIEELGWRLLLLVPLEGRQAQSTSTFVSSALAALLIVLLLAGTFFFLFLFYKQNLEKQTEVDALTGLPNRSYVQRRYQQMERAGIELCAIIIDLDHFKAINDNFGHDAGDRVLKAAAESFKRELRGEDLVSRWGGEEFVMLIPAPSAELGEGIAERTRQNLETLSIETRESTVSVTASFGVAFGSAAQTSLTSLLAKADEMLYQAKQDGRNQVRVYTDG